MERSKHIVIDGMDGSGKSSIVKLLSRTLSDAGHKVETIQNPGSSCIGKTMRKLVKTHESLTPLVRQILIQADTIQAEAEYIQSDVDIFIHDRYTIFSMTTNGIAGGLSEEQIKSILNLSEGMNIYKAFILSCSTPEKSLSRIKSRNFDDYYDNQALEFHKRQFSIYANIQEYSELYQHYIDPSNIIPVNTDGKIEDIAQYVADNLKELL